MNPRKLHINKRLSRIGYPGVSIDTFEVRSLPLGELHPPVSVVPVFVEEIKESIAERGLINPIIVVRAPREDIQRHFYKIHGPDSKPLKLPEDRPVINMVWGGNNRLDAIRELGYTHVDCVIIPDFFAAMLVQNAQRDAYNSVRTDAAKAKHHN